MISSSPYDDVSLHQSRFRQLRQEGGVWICWHRYEILIGQDTGPPFSRRRRNIFSEHTEIIHYSSRNCYLVEGGYVVICI